MEYTIKERFGNFGKFFYECVVDDIREMRKGVQKASKLEIISETIAGVVAVGALAYAVFSKSN